MARICSSELLEIIVTVSAKTEKHGIEYKFQFYCKNTREFNGIKR